MAAKWRGEGGQHQGARAYQEDSWSLRALADGSLIAVVADGMGGHAGGAVASRTLLDAFVSAVVEGGADLEDALRAGNDAVRDKAASDASLTGMGSTLLAVRLKGDEIEWISVGDSPLYLQLGEKLERLNADHSMAPHIDSLVAQGVISAVEAASHPGRHALRDAVMGEPLKLIDHGRRRLLVPEAILFLCSDGVESLSHERLVGAAGQSVGGIIDAVLAMKRPRQDNVTVIKLEMRS
jgi:PPM family protein phosphatase